MGSLRRSLAIACCGLVFAGCEDEETPPQGPAPGVQDPRRLAWEQLAADVAQLREFRFRVYVDDAPASLTGAECGPSGAPDAFTCTAPLPPLSRGSHLIAVSAIVNGKESPRSNPVMVTANAAAAPATALGAAAGPAAGGLACVSASACVEVSPVLTMPTPISAPLATPDGRLWFIEDGRYVRVMADGVLIEEPALRVPHDGVRFTALLADRSFAETRVIRVARVDDSDARARSVSLVAFRESDLRLRDAATIVPPIPLPPDGDPQVAEDGEGRIYLAIPASRGTARRRDDVYSGSILRLTPDGRVPWSTGQRSPIWKTGLERPAALAFDPIDGQIWISGRQSGAVVMRGLGLTGPEAPSVWLGPGAGEEFESILDAAGLVVVGLRATGVREQLARALAAWPLAPAELTRLRGLAREAFGASRAVSIGAGADRHTYIVTRANAAPHVHTIHRLTNHRATPRRATAPRPNAIEP